jgi:His-Xaa-Ser system protein HxsD
MERLTLDTTLYARSAVFRTCYKFTDRAYLFLKRDGTNQLIVEIRNKNANESLREVVGEFMNELIDQQIRTDLAAETQTIRDWVVAQAFAEGDFPHPTLIQEHTGHDPVA